MRVMSLVFVLAGVVLTGCTDQTLGGNVANGDRHNYPTHPYDARVANGHNPTGNQSGPWVGESGLNDTWTGISDRVAAPAGERATSTKLAPESTRSGPEAVIRSSDEQSTPVDLPAPDPTAEVR